MDPKEISKNLTDLSSQLKDSLGKLTPQLNEVMQKIQTAGANMQPKLMKNCTIDKQKAKITLFIDESIKIEFEDNGNGLKFYNQQK